MKSKLLFAFAAIIVASQCTQAQWSLTGNAGTTPTTNFVGTTDGAALRFRTNNVERMSILTNGRVGVGTTTPQSNFDIYVATAGVTMGVRSDSGNAALFFDKKHTSDYNTVSYRTNGVVQWQTGSIGNDNYVIKNMTLLAPSLTCVKATNYVGIGTNLPSERLEVAGNIRAVGTITATGVITATGGTSTNWNTAFSWGDHHLAGYLTSFTETDPKVSSTTNNQVPKWNSTALVDGIITDNGNSVGIGTSTPAAKFEVKSTSSNFLAKFNGTPASYMAIFEDDIYRGYWGSFSGNPEDVDFGTGAGTTGKLHLTIQAVPKLTIDNTGNVGIGTTSPNTRLHVTGGDLFVESSSGRIRFGYSSSNEWQLATVNGGADLKWGTSTNGGSTVAYVHYFSQNGNVGLGGFNASQIPVARLEVIGSGTSGVTNTFMLRKSNNDTIMRVRDDGKIGIGYNGVSYGRTLSIQGTGINFYASQNGFGGAIFPTDTSLVIWSNSGSNNNVILQPSWGSVGIGTSDPKARLHVKTGTSASLSSGGFIVAGSTTLANLAIDSNQIMARNNGAASNLFLNSNSGDVIINGTNSGSNLGIGTTTPVSDLHIVHANGINSNGITLDDSYAANLSWNIYTASTNELWLNNNGTHRGSFNGTSGAYTAISDRKFKKDIIGMDNVLEKVMKLNPSLYHFNTQQKITDRKFIGMIAQEVQPLFPEAVYEHNGKNDGTDDFLTLDYSAFGVIAIKAIQEQQKVIADKTEELNAVKKEVEILHSQLNEMQQCVQSLCETSTLKNNSNDVASANTRLFQNQPNPFNQTTIIRYELSEKENQGKIIVRDLSGNLVKSFAINNSGIGQVIINANELAAGIYTYTLEVSSQSIDTKLMVVTK